MESGIETEFLPQFLKMIIALGFVVFLMVGLSYILKRFGLAGSAPLNPSTKRLKVIESLSLDPRRRLMLIQRDDKQHLVILGANGETVVESDIDTAYASKLKTVQSKTSETSPSKKILGYAK